MFIGVRISIVKNAVRYEEVVTDGRANFNIRMRMKKGSRFGGRKSVRPRSRYGGRGGGVCEIARGIFDSDACRELQSRLGDRI